MQSIFIGPETNVHAVQKALSIDLVLKKFQNHLTLFLPVFVSVAPPVSGAGARPCGDLSIVTNKFRQDV